MTENNNQETSAPKVKRERKVYTDVPFEEGYILCMKVAEENGTRQDFVERLKARFGDGINPSGIQQYNRITGYVEDVRKGKREVLIGGVRKKQAVPLKMPKLRDLPKGGGGKSASAFDMDSLSAYVDVMEDIDAESESQE